MFFSYKFSYLKEWMVGCDCTVCAALLLWTLSRIFLVNAEWWLYKYMENNIVHLGIC